MPTTVATSLVTGWAKTAPARLAKALEAKLGGEEPKLICAFASPTWDLKQVSAAMLERFPQSCLIAASSAGEFAGLHEATGAASVFAVAGDYVVRAGYGHGLTDTTEGAVRQALSDSAPPVAGYPYRTALILLDPLTGKGEEASLIAGAILGPEVPIVGGAAGDDLAMASTEVALGHQSGSDALVVAVVHSKTPLGLGVKHGHKAISKDLTVTHAVGNTVYQVNGMPAWDVWMEHTRRRAASVDIELNALTEADQGAFLLRFEAGLPVGKELKIRAPLSKGNDGSLTFACGLPEGAVFRITESDPELQVRSAQAAARLAREQLNGAEVAGSLVFDCICRKLILGTNFSTAVTAICNELGTVDVAGFETYGEIALAPGDMSGFHNTTTVVLAFPR